MKKILLALILLVAAGFGAMHFIWNKAASDAEAMMEKSIQKKMQQMPELNISYDMETSGYPFAIKITYSNIRSEYKEPQTGELLVATMNSPIVAEASLFNPSTVDISSKAAEIDVKFPDSFMEKMGEDAMPIKFSLGWDSLNGTYDINNLRSGETRMMGLKMVAGAEAMPMTLTVKDLLSRQNITEDSGLVSGDAYLNMKDMEVRLAVVSVPISLYETDLTFSAFPVSDKLQEISRKVQMKSKDELTDEELQMFIDALKGYVQDMITNQSGFTLNTLRIESDSLQFNLSGGAKLTADALVDGGFDMSLSGIQKLIDMIPEDHPSKQMAGMASMMSDGETLELSVAFKDGMLVFNGAPTFPIPPLNTLLENIKLPAKPMTGMHEEHAHSEGDMVLMPDVEMHMDADMNMEMVMPEDPMVDTPTDLPALEAMPEMMDADMDMAPEVQEEEKPKYPQSEADLEVTEEDLQKMLMEIDETLKNTETQ